MSTTKKNEQLSQTPVSGWAIFYKNIKIAVILISPISIALQIHGIISDGFWYWWLLLFSGLPGTITSYYWFLSNLEIKIRFHDDSPPCR